MAFGRRNLPPPPDDEPAFTVTGLNGYIKEVIDSDEILQSVVLQGEVTDFRAHSSGHWYFGLKDAESQIRAVMWKGDTIRTRYKPENGARIRAHGRVSVYPLRGEYQIVCDSVQPLQAVGDLEAQLRALFDKLQGEGLFEDAIKRPIPRYPARIGVVTSAGAAAYQDVLNVLQRRFPVAHVLLSPTPVQGMDAPPQIIRALHRADRARVDVILLVRGGGSMEDLWCFNDERLVRAIRATRAPVITGVGHEIDTTLVDHAADLRAPTPSAAGERATPDLNDTRMRVAELAEALTIAAVGQVEFLRGQVALRARDLEFQSPRTRIAAHKARISELTLRLSRAIRANRQDKVIQLAAASRALELANPQNLLARGYAIVARPDGERIRAASQLHPTDSLRITFADGDANVEVKSITE